MRSCSRATGRSGGSSSSSSPDARPGPRVHRREPRGGAARAVGRHREGAARALALAHVARLGARRHLRLDHPALAHLHPAHRARAAARPPIAFFASVAHRHERGCSGAPPPRAPRPSTRRRRWASCSPCRRGAEKREAAVYDDLVGAECALEQRALLFTRCGSRGSSSPTARWRSARRTRAAASRGDLNAVAPRSSSSWKIGEGIGQLSFVERRVEGRRRDHASTPSSSARPRSRRSPARRSTPPRRFCAARCGCATSTSRTRRAPSSRCSGVPLTMRPGAVTPLVGPSAAARRARPADRPQVRPDGGAVASTASTASSGAVVRGEVLGVVSQDPVCCLHDPRE